jgi:perosamine synthetase
MTNQVDRRQFLGIAAVAAGSGIKAHAGSFQIQDSRPALLGGQPVRKQPFPSWPRFGSPEEEAMLRTLRSGKWFRGYGQEVASFEKAYAQMTGARFCLATANGTSALLTSLHALDIQPGDEIILPPYTFVATLNVVLLHYALPIFVDTDADTFQIDAKKVEAAITPRTRVLMPVHIGGSPADLDTLLDLSRKRGIPLLEDACQAHFGEWRGRKLGTLGTLGCFSFQASKNLNSGEGGAILTDREDLVEKCYTFHNNSRPRKRSGPGHVGRGANLRMTEFQGALLKAQMLKLAEQTRVRQENAALLTKLLDQVGGVTPARMYPGCTGNAYHLFMARYRKEDFGGLSRRTFLKALQAEGVPCSAGYASLNRDPYIREVLSSRGYRAIYPAELLQGWEERTACPVNDKLCEEGLWFAQTMFLGTSTDMEQIAAAVQKMRKYADELRKAETD